MIENTFCCFPTDARPNLLSTHDRWCYIGEYGDIIDVEFITTCRLPQDHQYAFLTQLGSKTARNYEKIGTITSKLARKS